MRNLSNGNARSLNKKSKEDIGKSLAKHAALNKDSLNDVQALAVINSCQRCRQLWPWLTTILFNPSDKIISK